MLVPVCLLCWRWHVENAVSSGWKSKRKHLEMEMENKKKKSSTAFKWTQKIFILILCCFHPFISAAAQSSFSLPPFLPTSIVALNIAVIYFYFVFFKHYLCLDVTLYRHFQNDGIKVDYRLCFMFRLAHCCAKFRPFWDA